MRHAIVLVLALVAAFVPPMRQACGTTCVGAVDGPAAAHHVAAPEAETCHKVEAAPAPEPSSEHCTHDHSGSLRPAPRATAEANAGQPAIIASFSSAQLIA